MNQLPALSLNPSQTRNSAIPGPETAPELYEGVLLRRSMAFCVDWILIGLILFLLWWTKILLTIATFGAFLLISIPLAGILPSLYAGLTLKHSSSGTPGMRLFDISLRQENGQGLTFPLGLLHAICFYVSFAITGALILLVPLFNKRGKMVQDFLLGVQAVRASRFKLAS